MLFKSALVLWLLVAASDASPFSGSRHPNRDLDGRIIGGAVVDITTYPWMASLQFLTNHRCGGSIISPKWVLTAANTVYATADFYYTIRAGTSTRESGGTVYDVASMILHPDFDTFTIDKDIGVFEISGYFTFGDTIQDINFFSNHEVKCCHCTPQPVNLAEDEPAVDAAVTLTGWGMLTSSGGLVYAEELQAVTTAIMERNACNATYECEIYREGCVTENMICTTDKPWCSGDGGGPLVAGNTQYGIASWGYTCGPGYPGVYTNVAALRSWVTQTTGI